MKTLILIFFAAITILSAHSQITLSNFHNYDIGLDDTYHVDQNSFEIENDGENQIWDVSTAIGETVTNTFVDPTMTPFTKNFPAANIALTSNEFYAYYNQSEDGIENLGFVLDGFVSCVYSDTYIQAQYPFNFGDSYTDSLAGELLVEGFDEPGSRSGVIINTADAYGQLILPWGTVSNTLRLKLEFTVVDEIDGMEFEATEIIYFWFDEEYGAPLASYSIASTPGFPTTFSLSYATLEDYNTIIEQNEDAKIEIFPNPSIEFIQVSGLTGSFSYEIINQQGQKVLNGNSTGNEKIYLDELSSGIYFIQIVKDSSIFREKFIVG